MSISRKSIFLNLFWSSTSFITSLVRTLFLIPIFLRNWDTETYGFWVVIFTFYSYAIYVIEGYSRYTINEYSKRFFKDERSAYNYFGDGLRFLIFLSGVFIALLLLVFNFTGSVEKLFLVNDEVINAYKLQYCLLLVFILACVHSISKYLGYAILPHGKIYIPERFTAIYVFVESALWIIAALGYMSLFSFFILYAALLAFISVLFVVMIAGKYPFYKRIFLGGHIKNGLKNSFKAFSFVLNNFCEKSTVEGLVFMVSSMFSAIVVPVYYNIRTMVNFMVTGTNMIVATFTIEYQKHNVNKDGRALFNLFTATWLLVGFIINYGTVIFYPFIPGIFRVWTHYKVTFDYDFFNYVLATSVFIVYGSNIITYLKSVNSLRQVFIVSVSRAILLFSLIIIFPKQLVFIGLSLLITEFVINIIILNVMLYYELGRFQYGAVAGKIFWCMVPFITTVAFVLTNQFIDIEAYTKMTITLIVITTVYFFQIMKLDNEALIVRLQTIKYRVLSVFRR